MFTDVEIGLAMRHRRQLAAYAGEAQLIVDAKNDELARVRRALAAAQRQNGDLILERGSARNEVLARRLAREH